MNTGAINLKKGEGINLTKTKPSLTNIRVGLGWNEGNINIDLDASVFACTTNHRNEPKLLTERHFVFYNNLATPNGSIVHSGDDRSGGDGDENGDCETIRIMLDKIEKEVNELSFFVTIHEGIEKRQHFGQLSNSYIRIYDDNTNDTICEYKLDGQFDRITSIQFGSVIRDINGWSFKAVGAGYKLGLGDIVNQYLPASK